MADKACSSRANRAWLRRHAIKTVISVKEDQKKHRRHRGRAGRRPPVFDPGRYKRRNTVETSKPQYCHVRPGAAVVLAPRHVVQGAQALDFGRILSALPVTGVSIGWWPEPMTSVSRRPADRP